MRGSEMQEVQSPERAPRTRVEQAAYVVEKVRSLGVRVHPASRLMLMLRTLERGRVEYDDSRFPVALESIRDFYQLRLIVDQMDAHRQNPQFLESVEKLLKDAPLPQEGGASTNGRDTQFELYVAAVCLRGGMAPVDYHEPDVACTVAGRRFGIAAKRIKSLGRFEERVKEGANQTRRAGVPGVVAIDWTIARNPENRPITSRLQSRMSVMIAQARNRQFFGRHEHDIHRWVDGSGVRALLTFEFTFRVNTDGTGWVHDGMMCWFPTTGGEGQPERELRAFRQGFLRGMPGVEDLTAGE